MKNNILILLFLSGLFSCTNNGESPSEKTEPNDKKESEVQDKTNPLDQILGDKILDLKTQKIRNSNFENLIGIPATCLSDSSTLYKLTEIDNGYYLLQQKRSYNEARLFNLLLKTENGKVSKYFLLNDFLINDIQKNDTGFLLLCSDWTNKNIFWKSEHQILILMLDKDFREIWKYVANPKRALNAENIDRSNKLAFSINIISGCDICYTNVRLRLDENGKFLSVEYVSSENSSLSSEESFDEYFNSGN